MNLIAEVLRVSVGMHDEYRSKPEPTYLYCKVVDVMCVLAYYATNLVRKLDYDLTCYAAF